MEEQETVVGKVGNQGQKPSVSPLCLALWQGNWPVAKALLSMGLEWDMGESGPIGEGLLTQALDKRWSRYGEDKAGQEETAVMLVRLGADPFAVVRPADVPANADLKERFPLRAASLSSWGSDPWLKHPLGDAPFSRAFRLGMSKVLEEMAKAPGVGKKRLLDLCLEMTPGAVARAMSTSDETTMGVLLGLGLDPNDCAGWEKSSNGYDVQAASPPARIGLLAEAKTPQMAQLLLSNGARPDVPGLMGRTAIENFAGLSQSGARERNLMVEMLMKADGSEPKKGEARTKMPNEQQTKALFAAAAQGGATTLKKLLSGFPKEADGVLSDGVSLLMTALAFGQFATARFLVEKRGMSLAGNTPDDVPAFVWGLVPKKRDKDEEKKFAQGVAWLTEEIERGGLAQGRNIPSDVMESSRCSKLTEARPRHARFSDHRGLMWACSKNDPAMPGAQGKSALDMALGQGAVGVAAMMMRHAPKDSKRVSPAGFSYRAALLGTLLGGNPGDGLWWDAMRDFSTPRMDPDLSGATESEWSTMFSFMAQAANDSGAPRDHAKRTRITGCFSQALGAMRKAGLELDGVDARGFCGFESVAAAAETSADMSRLFYEVSAGLSREGLKREAALVAVGMLGSDSQQVFMLGVDALIAVANGQGEVPMLPSGARAWKNKGAMEALKSYPTALAKLESALMEDSTRKMASSKGPSSV